VKLSITCKPICTWGAILVISASRFLVVVLFEIFVFVVPCVCVRMVPHIAFTQHARLLDISYRVVPV